MWCPICRHHDVLQMPTDACVFFHPCAGCQTLLRPKAGDCCVFCSYGSVRCPPVQQGAGCCVPAGTDGRPPAVAPSRN
nr:GDCCVxC domain-containing (seleno)protein [Gemmatimonas sp. UBA7669]